MSVIAKLKYLRISPRKVRLVADLIRGKSAKEAQTILDFATKRAGIPLLKLLRQAMANAKNNFQLDPDNLYIAKIIVDEGPKQKRWQARARGQAYEIQKKTSHITIILDEIKKSRKKVRRAKLKEIKEAQVSEKEKIFKAEKPPKESKPPTGQAKFKPTAEIKKPKIERGIRRIFRRKAF